MTVDPFHDLIHSLRGQLLSEMPPAQVVLSAGCSGTWYFKWFEEEYPHEIESHIGFDIDPRPDDLPPNIEYHQQSFCDMSEIPDAGVDLIFAGQAIEHVSTAESFSFYEHAFRVLKPDGWLVLDSPNFTITALWPYVNPDHIIEYRPDQMRSILKAAGLKVINRKGILLCKENGKVLSDPYAYERIDQRRIREAKDRAEDSFIWWIEARRDGTFNAERLFSILRKTNRQYEREMDRQRKRLQRKESVPEEVRLGRSLWRTSRQAARRVVPRPLRSVARKAFKRITGLYYRDQMAVLSDIRGRVSHLQEALPELESRAAAQDELMSLAVRRLRGVERHLETLDESVHSAMDDLAGRDADLQRSVRSLASSAASSTTAFWGTPTEESGDQLVMTKALSDFYIQFQNRHRGSEELIRERQRGRVPYFKSCRHVLDIGCGRGEFLELIQEHGIAAEGIDLSDSAVEACLGKGLKVSRAEALAFLATKDEGTFDGIHMSHVVEHVPFSSAVQLLEGSIQHLAAGGVLVIETPNPHSPETLQAFFLDPTHVRPLFPEAMLILLESLGLEDVEVHFLNPVTQQANGTEMAPRDFADYLVVGTKAPPGKLLSGTLGRRHLEGGSRATARS